MNEINIMIVEDKPLVRRAFKESLNLAEGMKVVAEASNGEQAIDFLTGNVSLKIDVILMDLFLNDEQDHSEPGGFIASDYILQNLYVRKVHEFKILILTYALNGLWIKKALDKEISGYLPKDCEYDELINAIRIVSKGVMYYRGRVWDEYCNYVNGIRGEVPFGDVKLTDAEMELLVSLTDGYSLKEIAVMRELSEDTIGSHSKNLKEKLKARSLPHAVSIAYKKGILKIY
ncbi:MAG: response regulator transcription factor [Bacteroidia bacterium]